MAINTYTGIKTALRAWTNQDSTTISDSLIDEFVETVEDEIYTDLRIPEMRDMYTFTYASGGVAADTIDANLIELISISVVVATNDIHSPTPAAEFRIRELLEVSDATHPEHFGWVTQADGTTKLVIGPEPTDKTVNLSFWKRFASLDTGTNAAFLKYPGIWLSGLVAEGFLFMQDFDMYQVWRDRFTKWIANANTLGRGKNEALKGNTPKANIGYRVP